MEVPELIKNASETTATTLSHFVDDVKDRLDGSVLHRHAPPPPKKHFPVRAVVLVVAGAFVVMMAVGRRCAAKWRGEKFTEPKADRPPTPDEARTADRFASRVDLDSVGRHFDEMTDRGANVEGEGQVEPSTKAPASRN